MRPRKTKTVMEQHLATFAKVIGALFVIAIGLFIAFPVCGCKDGEKAHQTSCLSNQKQLALAVLQYAQDNDNLMPNISDTPGSTNTWRAMIYPNTKNKSIYRCPDDKAPDGPDGFPPSYAANYSGSYNNGSLDKGYGAFAGPGSHPLSLAKFPDPHSLILLCEVQHSTAPEFNIDDPVRFGPAKYILAPRHVDGSNYLLADGHSKWLHPLASAPFWYRDTHRPISPNAAAVLRSAHG